MKKNKLPSVLIVGLGNIGMGYDLQDNTKKKILTHSKSFFLNKSFELVGGVDINGKARAQFQERYISNTFKTIKDAMINTNPKIVVISTSTKNHLQNVRDVFVYGKPKILICEKPLSFNYADSVQILKLCELNQAKLYVNYFRRVIPSILDVLNLIDLKKIKKPFFGTCFYSKGLYNSASHFINLFEFFFGEVLNVKIINDNFANKVPELYPDIEPDFELEFPDGKIVFISNKNKSIFINSFELIMENGKLIFENGGNEIFWQPIIDDKLFSGYRILGEKLKLSNNDFDNIQLYFANELGSILECRKSSLCSGDQALSTQKVLETINKEVCKKKKIKN